MIRRLISWPPILPVGRVSLGADAGAAAGAGVSAVALVWPPRVKGTAAEAIRDDFTKPRREICRVMGLLLPIPMSNVKEQMVGSPRQSPSRLLESSSETALCQDTDGVNYRVQVCRVQVCQMSNDPAGLQVDGGVPE